MFFYLADDVQGGLRDNRTGAKNACNTCLVEEIVILGGNHPASHNEDVRSPLVFQRLNDLWHQRFVSRRQAGDPHHVYVILNGLTRRFFRRLEQWPYIHIKTNICKA